ncbi:MAG TPA: hypothetical protein VG651_15955 [Stellaceae bacterium]|nr:hypothetical protein [Stellaceae bacterium]
MKLTSLEDQAAVIEEWKRRNGVSGRDYVPPNSGLHRSLSKRHLLRAMAEDAQKHRRKAVFPAKY